MLPKPAPTPRTMVVVALPLALCVTVSGCGLLPESAPPQPSKVCSATYDPDDGREPLGDGDKFIRAAENAAATPGIELTAHDLATSAGWTGTGWDRMIVQVDGMSDDALNSAAQTPGMCWSTIKSVDSFNNELPGGNYIFLTGKTPVQSIRWAPGDDVIRIDPSHALTSDARLRSVADIPSPILEPVSTASGPAAG